MPDDPLDIFSLSHEGLALDYWPIEKVTNWHPNHDKYAGAAYNAWKSDRLLPAISD